MTHDSDERSTSRNRPIHLFTITTPDAVFHHTSHPVDVPFGGSIYTALTMDRGSQQLANDPGVDELSIALPITHPLVRSYASAGIPPQTVSVLVQNLQTVSGTARTVFRGVAQSMSVDTRTATIRCPASTADALKIQLPVVGATRFCNHRLFDGRCAPNPGGQWPLLGPSGSGGPSPGLFTITNAIVFSVSTDGLTIAIVFQSGTPDPLDTKPDGWATLGRIIVGSEQRRILTQISTTITLAVPIPGLLAGSVVTIEAGCMHDMTTCKTKFNNQLNFGGHPKMTSFNAWAQNGFGVIQQV